MKMIFDVLIALSPALLILIAAFATQPNTSLFKKKP